jgi:hypothetical protein
MMGLDTPETCRGWRNILRISCALSWFLFTRLYRDERLAKHETDFVCFWLDSPPVGQGLLIHEVSRAHTTTQHSR